MQIQRTDNGSCVCPRVTVEHLPLQPFTTTKNDAVATAPRRDDRPSARNGHRPRAGNVRATAGRAKTAIRAGQRDAGDHTEDGQTEEGSLRRDRRPNVPDTQFYSISSRPTAIVQQAWVLNKLKMPSRAASPLAADRSEHKPGDSSELQAILTQQSDQGICFLRDSPFRILRVSVHLRLANTLAGCGRDNCVHNFGVSIMFSSGYSLRAHVGAIQLGPGHVARPRGCLQVWRAIVLIIGNGVSDVGRGKNGRWFLRVQWETVRDNVSVLLCVL